MLSSLSEFGIQFHLIAITIILFFITSGLVITIACFHDSSVTYLANVVTLSRLFHVSLFIPPILDIRSSDGCSCFLHQFKFPFVLENQALITRYFLPCTNIDPLFNVWINLLYFYGWAFVQNPMETWPAFISFHPSWFSMYILSFLHIPSQWYILPTCTLQDLYLCIQDRKMKAEYCCN